MLVCYSLIDFKDSVNAVRMQEPIVQTDRASIILEIKLAPGPFGLAGNGRGKALIYGKRILNQRVWDNAILVIDEGAVLASPGSPPRNCSRSDLCFDFLFIERAAYFSLGRMLPVCVEERQGESLLCVLQTALNSYRRPQYLRVVGFIAVWRRGGHLGGGLSQILSVGLNS